MLVILCCGISSSAEEIILPDMTEADSTLYHNICPGYAIRIPDWLEEQSEEFDAELLSSYLPEYDENGTLVGAVHHVRCWQGKVFRL